MTKISAIVILITSLAACATRPYPLSKYEPTTGQAALEIGTAVLDAVTDVAITLIWIDWRD